MPEENEENIKLLNRRVTRNCEQTGRGRIRINVSGLEFKTYASTLERFPGWISSKFPGNFCIFLGMKQSINMNHSMGINIHSIGIDSIYGSHGYIIYRGFPG